MYQTKGYAAYSSTEPLRPYEFQRRALGARDILIDITYSGICHSDIHQARGEWGGSVYPMVPGHEIVGTVAEVGKGANKFKVGDSVGVGVFVDSCRTCSNCREGLEQYCENHLSLTYNSTEQDRKTPTYGGYSTRIVVDENYVVSVPKNLDASAVAPLLCAGITTYSPLRHWNVRKGLRVAILGLGGLGHMAVKFAASFGADVTVLSTSRKKEEDAKRFGAKDFAIFTEKETLGRLDGKFDFILDTVSAPHDMNTVAGLLKRDGTMVLVGLPTEPVVVSPFTLIGRRIRIAGSAIGGIRETQEMLDYCGEHGIVSDVEVIAAKDMNVAYDRTVRSDVRYRFVIDGATFNS